MGLNIVFQDEAGKEIENVADPTNILLRFLTSPDDADSRCLRYVDPYGDTVFNRLQIADVLKELVLLSRRASAEDERELFSSIIGLANRCQATVHTYLKFYGD